MVELLILTFIMTIVSFVLPLLWGSCTAIPTDTADWTTEQVDLLDELVQYQCKEGEYNQVASLFFVPADVAMQQLYHFREIDGTSYVTFETGALLLFFIPYFFLAAITPGTLCPAGLFVPTLLAGAAFGRIIGHILNLVFPGSVTDAGTYALIGAAALMGGMSRMTISGTIIILEASGNNQYLLPLMITFAAARYSGNAINDSMYDMVLSIKKLPFLEGSLKTLGLLNYHPIVEIMAQPVVTLSEINKVGTVHRILSTKNHNGFPVISKNGHLRGLILRKTLCSIIKLKAFSAEINNTSNNDVAEDNDDKELAPAATVFHDTLERNYPNYPRIEDIVLTPAEQDCWLDIRPYMDTSPYTIHTSSSVQRCYRFFRTMGLRHLVVLDGDHRVAGMITRKDITEHRLEHHWFKEGDNMQKFINLDSMRQSETKGLLNNSPEDSPDDNDNDDNNGNNMQESYMVTTLNPMGSYSPPSSQASVGSIPQSSSSSMNTSNNNTTPLKNNTSDNNRRAMKEPKSINRV